MRINWDERGIPPLPKPYRVILKQAVLEGLRHEGKTKGGELSLSFVSGEEIRGLNNMYRQKDTPTDVLSFPDSMDIVICVEVAKRQAEEYGHSLERELAFLTVHGLLHLLGYDHCRPEDEAVMLKIQEEILLAVGLSRQ